MTGHPSKGFVKNLLTMRATILHNLGDSQLVVPQMTIQTVHYPLPDLLAVLHTTIPVQFRSHLPPGHQELPRMKEITRELPTWVHMHQLHRLTNALDLRERHREEGTTTRGLDIHVQTRETIEDTCLPRRGPINLLIMEIHIRATA